MRGLIGLALIGLFCVSPVNAQRTQVEADYTIETEQLATSATIIPSEGGVLIRSKELQDEKHLVAVISADERATVATIWRIGQKPKNISAKRPGEFAIRGPPGGAAYTVFVWPVEPNQGPAILDVEIPAQENPCEDPDDADPDDGDDPDDPGDPDDDDDDGPIPPEVEAVIELVQGAVDQLDTPTAKSLGNKYLELATEIREKCEQGDCPSLLDTRGEFVSAYHRLTKDPSQPWYQTYLVPLERKLISMKIQTVDEYLEIMRVVGQVLAR